MVFYFKKKTLYYRKKTYSYYEKPLKADIIELIIRWIGW